MSRRPPQQTNAYAFASQTASYSNTNAPPPPPPSSSQQNSGRPTIITQASTPPASQSSFNHNNNHNSNSPFLGSGGGGGSGTSPLLPRSQSPQSQSGFSRQQQMDSSPYRNNRLGSEQSLLSDGRGGGGGGIGYGANSGGGGGGGSSRSSSPGGEMRGGAPRFGPTAPLSTQINPNASYASLSSTLHGTTYTHPHPNPPSSSGHSSGRSSPVGNIMPGGGVGSTNSRGGYIVAGTGAAGGGGGNGAGLGLGLGLASGNGEAAGSREDLSGEKFSLSADPNSWGAETSPAYPEEDDYLHNPDPKRDRKFDRGGTIFTGRGFVNVGCILLLVFSMLMVFGGYPILTHFITKKASTNGAYNLGGINGTGQVATLLFSLIDQDTPQSAYTYTSRETGSPWELVFSDEFNTDGRTFYEGDDPYWQAENLHYWSTNNLEWYDPKQVTTAGGSLVITLDKKAEHGLNYTGGLVTTWNKFCFRGGYLEANVSLPGKSSVYGLWPAVWTMGNLGRAGYGGTLEGMWPYSYNSCDVGTLKNQTLNGKPEIALTSGDAWAPYNGTLSYLEGQRLSACTCKSDTSHPGPRNPDGSFVGRSAPEIDCLEAQTDNALLVGQVSQSAQFAPFNPYYTWVNDSSTYSFGDPTLTALNSYQGGVYQQALSGVTTTDQNCYQYGTGCFSIYGFEYESGSSGYVRWVSDAKQSWMIRGSAMQANTQAQVGDRPIPLEPMYLLINLGMSENFGAIDYAGLAPLWPAKMFVDYIRVYQDPNHQMIGCDPPDMPTASYIAQYLDAYNDPNITTFAQIGSGPAMPKNSLIDTC